MSSLHSMLGSRNGAMLSLEPDVVIEIFLLLPVADICRAELVCVSWRWLINEYNIWKYKLIDYWNYNPFWKDILQQHDWKPNDNDHDENKRMCLKVAAIIPDELSEDSLKVVMKGSPLNEAIHSKTKLRPNFEHMFLQRLVNDKNKIISKLPKRPLGRIGWRRGPRKVKFPMAYSQMFSNLLLFGPSAFPILVEKFVRNDIILAGARYGKGRIIVASHHEILANDALIQGAADWCGNRINCPIIRDPTTKRENEDGTWSYTQVERRVPRSKWRSTYVARDKISSKIPVYLTEGHYDDHGEELMEYVRNGGGLIVGGYACTWNSDECTVLQYPGNKMIARTGIAFSNNAISTVNLYENSELQIESLVDNIPALKCSIYYSMKEYVSSQKLKLNEGSLETEQWMSYNWNIHRFYDELSKIQHFKGIFSIQNIY